MEVPGRRLLKMLHRLDIAIVALGILALIIVVTLWRTPVMIPSAVQASVEWAEPLEGQPKVYKLLGLPARFYIRLPRKLDDRYEWFTIDTRREIVSLLDDDPETTTWLGFPAVHRTDDPGLDLEFRDLDGLEWRIAFENDRVRFTNGRLTVTLNAD